MMLGTTTREVQLSRIEISAIDGSFSLPVEVTKVNKGELLYLDNPRYQQLLHANSHLTGVVIDDLDDKDKLPVHIILGASEYAKLKTETAPKIGRPGQPVAELTRFGWTIISPGKESIDVTNMLLCQTSHVDYEELCRLDVLRLADTPTNDQGDVYAEFKEQLTRDEEGWYETGLPRRGDHPPLPNNKNGSLRRLTSLVRKLERQGLTDDDSEMIEQQRAAGVVESAETPAVGREYYIPHKPVVRAEAESTKPRIVHDASARAYGGAPSMNECLYVGPPLKNKLWDVLVRRRFNAVAITGDLQIKAFLQVRVQREDDRDAMRFHWRRNEQSTTETLRLTRALFGLAPSPFLLGGVINAHLTSWEEREPEVVAKVKKELYVDDLISGSTTVNKARELKRKTATIFQDGCFKLHKWHSNVPELESVEAKLTFSLQKAVRVVAWMRRFVNNSLPSRRNKRSSGPLTTEETERQRRFWAKQAQDGCEIEDDRAALNLQPNKDGLLECRGRVQGYYPVYLPDTHMFSVRVVEEAHIQTLHGGVGLTMAKVRGRYWIPRLRRLVKKVRRNCHGCKRFQAIAYAAPPPADLPTTRTEGTNPYQVVGVDYAGPLRYRISQEREGKGYVLLYACSLTRGVYLDLLPNLETSECLLSLKQFIARRGRPDRIYSDNGRTFVGAARWMRAVAQDERIQNYLSVHQIRWQFNLSRAPWWGGQFERMIGLVKSALNKTIGNGMLRWKELQEVLFDVEVTLNNRPLSYVEEDVQFPLLTPNAMLFANSNILPELQPHASRATVRRRAKHLLKCKEAMWGRWTREYFIRGLRERHRALVGVGGASPKVGDVVIVKSEERNRGKWPLGIVESLIVGNDGVVRGSQTACWQIAY